MRKDIQGRVRRKGKCKWKDRKRSGETSRDLSGEMNVSIALGTLVCLSNFLLMGLWVDELDCYLVFPPQSRKNYKSLKEKWMESFANSSFWFKEKEQWWKKIVEDGGISRFACLSQFNGHPWCWIARILDPILEELKCWSDTFNSTQWKRQCLLWADHHHSAAGFIKIKYLEKEIIRAWINDYGSQII